MGKSNYPNKLDTSIEIPAVRDNIVEVGSDVLNSLRSAIFNIERTLGINPQGATGNTVASRVNRALDGNGNILKEALDKAGHLSGPITDADVSKVAAINESKLNLEYPTTLLQEEISQIIKQIENITVTLEELSYLYAAHTHPESKNRHMGHAITIAEINRTESDTGMVFSERQTSQELFEKVFSSHINYSGSDISESNRSHEAKQLFFDKSDAIPYVDSEDVQGAILDVLEHAKTQLIDHQNRHHSNGVLRTSLISAPGDITAGRMLLDEQEITYAKYGSEDTTKLSTIAFVDPPEIPSIPIERSDILRIYSGIDATSSDYQIHSVEYDGLTIKAVKIFGMLSRDSVPLDRVKIFKNKNVTANPASLLVAARHSPFPITNIDIVQVANPNSSTIISRGIRPSEISFSKNRYMNVIVDDEEEILLDVYDGSATSGQTVDSVIKAMNLKFAEKGASVLAYRVDYDDLHSPEIALVHSLPSTLTQSFSLSVTRKGTDGGIDSLGFGHMEDEVVDQGSGSHYYIQGKPHSGLDIKLEQTGLTLLEGTSIVDANVAGIDFRDYDVTNGDLLVITKTSEDNGTYVIKDIGEGGASLLVDEKQLTGDRWNSDSSQDSIFYILKNTVSLAKFNFLRPAGGGSNAAIIDIFLDENKNIFYNARLEYAIKVHGGSDSLISICDFEGDVSLYTDDDPGVISVSLKADGTPQLSLDGGPIVELSGIKSSYIRLRSERYDITLLIFIEDSGIITNKITADGLDFSIQLYGESDINLEENLLVARCLFDSKGSRIAGAGADLPRIFKKLESGITSDKDLSSKALERVYQGPIKETRSNGVTRGLKVMPATGQDNHESLDEFGKFVVNIDGGSCYVRGKKFTFDRYDNLISDVIAVGDVAGEGTADKVFIAVNEWGEIVFAEAGGGGGPGGACACPFDADSHCILAVIEYDSLNPPVAIDLRLFLSDLDNKVLNAVTVSPQPGMGHFTEFGEALKYAKRFGDMFPKAGVPTVKLKSGTHKVVIDTGESIGVSDPVHIRQAASYDGIWINFPVNITGEGHSTVLDIMTIYSDQGEDSDDRAAAGGAGLPGGEQVVPDHTGHLFIAGPGLNASKPNGNGDVLSNGFVTLSNFRMKDCAVTILDPWIENDLGKPLNWGVQIDGLIFDRFEKPDFGKQNYGVRFVAVDSEYQDAEVPFGLVAGGGVGNLSISNCQFLNSYALFSEHIFIVEEHKNISFINNTFRGEGYTLVPDYFWYWIVWNDMNTPGLMPTSNIYELSQTDEKDRRNIEFRGNILADSSGPYELITPDGAHLWGDRISKDFSVGGNLSVGGLHTTPPWQAARMKSWSGVANTYAFGAMEGGILVQDGDIRINQGNINLIDGNIVLSEGDITIANGDVTFAGGDITLEDGSITLNDGDITLENGDLYVTDIIVEDDEATLKMISTHSGTNESSTIRMYRQTDGITAGFNLGELRFYGRDDDGDNRQGAAIIAEASGAWENNNEPTQLRFFTTHSSINECMRLTSNGALRIGGGDDIDLDGSSGCLQIGYVDEIQGHDFDIDTGGGKHLALDDNEIQAKTNSTTAGPLHLNSLGGAVKFGGQEGTSEIVVDDGAITNVERIEGSDLNGLILSDDEYDNTYLKLSDNGIEMISQGGFTITTNDPKPVTVGSPTHDGPGMIIRNTCTHADDDTSAEGASLSGDHPVHATLQLQNYLEDGQNGTVACLWLEFPNVAHTDWAGAPGPADGAIDFGQKFVLFAANDYVIGSISGHNSSHDTIEYNAFTGQHIAPIKDSEINSMKTEGLIVSSDGSTLLKKNLSESFSGATLSSAEKDKAVYGVIAGSVWVPWEQRWKNWPEGVSAINVNALGNGRVWVTNITGEVETGDYICSSNIAGYGQLQDDDFLHNYTVAKATEAIDWDNVTDTITHNGVEYKKYLVACTYHCG